MIAKHKGTRNEHWKPLAVQAQPVRRMMTAPMLAGTIPDWAVSALASQMGVDASSLLVVGLATVAGVVRGRKVPTQVAAGVREAWAGVRRPRGGRHRE